MTRTRRRYYGPSLSLRWPPGGAQSQPASATMPRDSSDREYEGRDRDSGGTYRAGTEGTTEQRRGLAAATGLFHPGRIPRPPPRRRDRRRPAAADSDRTSKSRLPRHDAGLGSLMLFKFTWTQRSTIIMIGQRYWPPTVTPAPAGGRRPPAAEDRRRPTYSTFHECKCSR